MAGSEDWLPHAPSPVHKVVFVSLKHLAVSGFQILLPKHSYLEKEEKQFLEW